MHLLYADFQKLEEVTLVHQYDLFLPNFSGHDSTADSSKQSRLTYVFFAFQFVVVFLLFSLNGRRKWMPSILCGKQTKLSKTMGLDTMGEIISSRCLIGTQPELRHNKYDFA